MAKQTTWIKIDRNILNWRWYKDRNTKDVFLHLLLTANIEDRDFQLDTIHRGEVATSIGHLAESLGISYKETRTALKHLEEGKEVAIRRRPKYLVISILKYNEYQAKGTQRANEGQTKGNQRATIKEYKEVKNIPTVYIPTRGELADYVREEGLDADPDEIFDYYEAVGWRVGSKPVKDWKALCRKWRSYEKPKKKQTFDEMMAEAMQILDERDRKEGRI